MVTSQFAVCLHHGEYPASLERHKIYRVLADKDAEQDGDLRIIDESGEDYLYPAHYFMRIVLSQEMAQQLLNSFVGQLEPT